MELPELSLDVFRHLSLFLDMNTFLLLTSCCSRLRVLDGQDIIWRQLLLKDFPLYKEHPSYGKSRYIQCFRRRILASLEHSPDELGIMRTTNTALDNTCNKIDIYVNVNIPGLKTVLNLENWGLMYEGHEVLPYDYAFGIITAVMMFTSLDHELLSKIMLHIISNRERFEDATIAYKYYTKASDMLLPMLSSLSNFTKQDASKWVPGTMTKEDAIEYFTELKAREGYDALHKKWLHNGFQ